MQPSVTPLPVTRRGLVGRYVGMLLLSALSWGEIADSQIDDHRIWLAADLALGVACFIAVWWRREHPLAVGIGTALASAVSGTAGGPAALALVSVATRRQWREILPVAGVGLVAAAALAALDPEQRNAWPFAIPLNMVLLSIVVGWGMYIGSRRELLATLRDRAERAEAEQAARVAQARIAERTRIAREMHDVLAHRISMVSLQAGALSFREDLSADQMRDTARLIQEQSHRAMTELRELLGILRDDPVPGAAADDGPPEPPQPSAAQLPELIADAVQHGMRVTADLAADLDGVPDLAGRTGYRVVQEGLTNASKHSPGTVVHVEVKGAPGDGLQVRIANPLAVGAQPPPPSGFGLVGLAERVALAGGRLTYGTGADRRFELAAWIPWPS